VEPTLTTAPELGGILEELRRRAIGWKVLYHQGTVVEP
jgi:hypothetical protein